MVITDTHNLKRYIYGASVQTYSVVEAISPCTLPLPYFRHIKEGNGHAFRYTFFSEDRVYGLGEQVRGINKRGWIYTSWNTDDVDINENRESLYASHNFFIVNGKETFGVFIDSPGKVVFDIDYTKRGEMCVQCEENFELYVIEGETPLEIVRLFRHLIGRSYIPPKFAFGFAQSRWGYKNRKDIENVAEAYEKYCFPLDMIVLDIDYMDNYKDFTINEENFPDFPYLIKEMKKKGIRLIPIIDAAVKAEKGYFVYDEGYKNGYFCKDENGQPFVVGVWPGESVLPDFLNPKVRIWFGEKYKIFLEQGIEGFWNDMNEPSLFYSKKGLASAIEKISSKTGKNLSLSEFWEITGAIAALANNQSDYEAFFHDIEGKAISHKNVHNLFGYNMVRAASEYFEKYNNKKRYLLYSRSSHIGMHRYGGIWTGDNASSWEHLLLNLKMLPSLNMCGFLYIGADIGGFANDTTEDLMLRWLALGIFIPLMRNHSTTGSRRQECYVFEDKRAIKNFLDLRYSLIPYLYSEYVKSALNDTLMYIPLAFLYPQDERAKEIEDQLFVGDSIMIAPVYRQNVKGRYVYLPESMKLIKIRSVDDYEEEILPAGDHYIEVKIDEAIFFIPRKKALPLARPAKNTEKIDESTFIWLKNTSSETGYDFYTDDGFTTDICVENIRKVIV